VSELVLYAIKNNIIQVPSSYAEAVRNAG